MRCPWCGSQTVVTKRLCPSCHSRAVGATRLPPEEFDNLPYGLIELDRTGKILAFNSSEAQMSGFSPSDVIGRNFFKDVAPCTQVKEYEGRFKGFLSSDETDVEFNFTYPFLSGAVAVHIVFVKVLNGCILIVSREQAA